MALTADLYNIKSSGAYTYIIDKSQIDIRMEDRVMPLVVGFSDNGPRRMPVVITSQSQFNRYFGNENTKEYDKGNYFHKTAKDLLSNGRFIYAMNLAPINDSLIDMFNTDNGFTPNYGFESDMYENKFVKIYNSGKPTHIFIFENDKMNSMKLNGYDLTVSEYYQSPSLNPSGMPIPEQIENPDTSKVYEYYRNIYAFDGYFDDYYLKSLYDSGYNQIIKKGTKITIGTINGSSTVSEDKSSPLNQKIELTPIEETEDIQAILTIDDLNINILVDGVDEGNIPATISAIKFSNVESTSDNTKTEENTENTTPDTPATAAETDESEPVGDTTEGDSIEEAETETDEPATGDNTEEPETDPVEPVEPTSPSVIYLEQNQNVVTALCGAFGKLGDVLTIENVMIKLKEGETETWVAVDKIYVHNGDLDDMSIVSGAKVTYSDKSESFEFPSKITFNHEGFYIEPAKDAMNVEYAIIGDDKVQISGLLTFDPESKIADDLKKCIDIVMPYGCILNVDDDGTETSFTNKSDDLAVGSYSKLQMSTGNEVKLYPNPTSTYITANGIVVEPLGENETVQAVLAVKSTDIKIQLSQIGEVDTLQKKSLTDEWVYIKLDGNSRHTFTFGDALEPFIIENAEDKDGEIIYEGENGITTISLYCQPLNKTVAIKVQIGGGTGKNDETSSTILSCNGIEWETFVNDVLGGENEWSDRVADLVEKSINFQIACQDKKTIAQTFYLTGGEKTIETLSQVDGSGFIAKYSGFSIPGFIDAMGVNQEIKNAFNLDVFLHNTLLGTTDISTDDSYSNVLCDWMASNSYTPLYDGNKIANALIDSPIAEANAYKLLFGLTDSVSPSPEMSSIIPTPVDAPSCLHTGKNHKAQYGKGGYDYDYNCLDLETTNTMDAILVKSLVDNPYLDYRWLVDTIIHNGSYLNNTERCNKWVGTAITTETDAVKRRETIYHHNLFKIVNKYGKATTLVNAPYPIKTKQIGVYNMTKDCLPTDMDGNWRGTYTTAYKMMSYDTNNTSLISCQGHIYPSAGRECELCFQKVETRFIFTPVAGPNYGTIVDNYTTTPAEAFSKDDKDVLEPLGLNVLVYKNNQGTYINSNQTAKQRIISALSKFHVAELLTQMTIDIQKMMLQLQWELNTPQIRDYLKMKVDNYCDAIKNNGGLISFYNVCDSSNNTNEVIDNEMIVLDTGIEVSRASGKMVNRITIYKTGGIALAGL